jgi:hypothetical protein
MACEFCRSTVNVRRVELPTGVIHVCQVCLRRQSGQSGSTWRGRLSAASGASLAIIWRGLLAREDNDSATAR